MYTYPLYCAGRFRRMKEQGEVIFLFYFSFVHSLEISPDLKLIVTDCCELAVLRFSTTTNLASGDAMHLIKHNVPTYRSQPEQRQRNSPLLTSQTITASFGRIPLAHLTANRIRITNKDSAVQSCVSKPFSAISRAKGMLPQAFRSAA